MPGTVYLIAQPTISRDGHQPDITPLREHGEIRVLIQAGEYPTFHPQVCLDKIEWRLRRFNSATDFLAWAGGDTLAAVLTGVVIARMGMPSIRWLRYERGRDAKGRPQSEGGRYSIISAPLIPLGDADQLDLLDTANEGG